MLFICACRASHILWWWRWSAASSPHYTAIRRAMQHANAFLVRDARWLSEWVCVLMSPEFRDMDNKDIQMIPGHYVYVDAFLSPQSSCDSVCFSIQIQISISIHVRWDASVERRPFDYLKFIYMCSVLVPRQVEPIRRCLCVLPFPRHRPNTIMDLTVDVSFWISVWPSKNLIASILWHLRVGRIGFVTPSVRTFFSIHLHVFVCQSRRLRHIRIWISRTECAVIESTSR